MVALDIGSPARGLIETLNVGGTWGSNNERTGGTWPGTVASGSAYQPTAPYDGPTPAIFVSAIPMITNISIEGAQAHRIDGTLEIYYVDRLSMEQDVPLAVLDQRMADNCTAVINTILADPHLSDSVIAITSPLEVVRDPEGIFREWQGAPWLWCSMRVPFISKVSYP
jgi:hypothetical protein